MKCACRFGDIAIEIEIEIEQPDSTIRFPFI